MKLKNLTIGFGGICLFAGTIAKEFWGWPTALKVLVILVPGAIIATMGIMGVIQYNRLVDAIKEHRKAGEIEL